MENENKNKVFIIIICILAFIVVGLGAYILLGSEKKPEEGKKSYVGGYLAFVEHDDDYNEDKYYELFLREDGVFRLNLNTEAFSPDVGTYEIKDGKLLMKTKIAYGSDSCFYKDEEFMYDYSFDITEDDSFKYKVSDTNTDYIFKKDETRKETTDELKYYVLFPVVGDSENSPIDCTGDLTKKSEYESVFKEDGSLVIDYDIKTSRPEFDYKLVYDLVVKESSKLKKSKNINLFDYVGRAKVLASQFTYVNYDVYFYNLPKDVYEKNVEQIKTDKETKVKDCKADECVMNVTTGYKNISKYLVKKAFYYYVLSDSGSKVETRSILNKKYITERIPDEWLKLGSYKTKDAMYKDVLLMVDEKQEYKNYLVVYDTGSKIILKYKGKSKVIVDTKDYEDSSFDAYYLENGPQEDDTETDASAYVGGYKVKTDTVDDMPVYVYMYLRADGTYTYGNNSFLGGRNAGTYEIKDGKILLHDIVSYGSDACYFTDKSYLSDKTITIKDNNTLYDESKKYTFKKDNEIIEEKVDAARYITNPVDGKKPTPSDDEWMHCNADGSLINERND